MMKIELDKKPVTMKLSRDARELITALGAKQGMSATAVVEAAVRQMAAAQGVEVKREGE